METNRDQNNGQSCQSNNHDSAHHQYLAVLKRYSAGEISANQAASFMEPGASAHDVYSRVVQAGLHLPSPPQAVIDAQIQQALKLFGHYYDKNASGTHQ